MTHENMEFSRDKRTTYLPGIFLMEQEVNFILTPTVVENKAFRSPIRVP